MERALETIDLFAHFCRATGIDDVRPVATSAIRDATNQQGVPGAGAQSARGWRSRCSRREEEARYGYLAAVNSTTLADGVALDLGGGSMQLTHVADRRARDARSWPLGRRRMTERFLAGEQGQAQAAQGAARARQRRAGDGAAGSTTRARRRAARRHRRHRAQPRRGGGDRAPSMPSFGVQGFVLRARRARRRWSSASPSMTPEERGEVPGHQARARGPDPRRRVRGPDRDGARRLRRARGHRGRPARGRLLLDAARGPRPAAVRGRPRATRVLNLAAQYHADFAHAEHVARLALGMWDALGEAGLHPADPRERELLWAAAMLHDIGTAVDYDDHHKHSRYLILNAGLPGFTPRETALIGQMARYHRKGSPGSALAEPLARDGDEAALARCAAAAPPGRAARALARPVGARGARRGRRRPRRDPPRGRRGRDGRALGRRAPERPVRARVRQGAHAQGLTRGMPSRQTGYEPGRRTRPTSNSTRSPTRSCSPPSCAASPRTPGATSSAPPAASSSDGPTSRERWENAERYSPATIAGTTYTIGDGGPTIDQRRVVDTSFLELVRLGVKPAGDLSIRSTLPVVDRELGARDAARPVLAPLRPRRLRRDARRRPVRRVAATAAGCGRCWPASAASTSWPRASRGRRRHGSTRSPRRRARARCSPSRCGTTSRRRAGLDPRRAPGTLSATPLAWTHAQFVRLAWSLDAGRAVERPEAVACRYVKRCP